MRTYFPSGKTIESKWYLIDAKGLVVGRVSTFIATLLRGKNKPHFTPFLDVGDHVVVINAEKVVLTGKKLEDKEYYHHTSYPGGLKAKTAKELMEKCYDTSYWGRGKQHFFLEIAYHAFEPNKYMPNRYTPLQTVVWGKTLMKAFTSILNSDSRQEGTQSHMQKIPSSVRRSRHSS